MRKLIFLLLLAGIACKEISYKETQPIGSNPLRSVPEALRGSFVVSDTTGKPSDTLLIDSKGYYTASDKRETLLGDSLQLKFYKGLYFANVNENPEWLLRVIKVEKNGDLTFMSMPTNQDTFNKLIKDLSKKIKVDSLTVRGEKLYQIDPSPKELMSLIRKGYFSQRFVMKRIQ